jgi:hypothetical protein
MLERLRELEEENDFLRQEIQSLRNVLQGISRMADACSMHEGPPMRGGSVGPTLQLVSTPKPERS